MMHFEKYHWEDHVPRKDSWKLNLAVGALAFGLIAAALPEVPDVTSPTVASSVKPTVAADLSGFDAPRRQLPAAFAGASRKRTPCPIERADS